MVQNQVHFNSALSISFLSQYVFISAVYFFSKLLRINQINYFLLSRFSSLKLFQTFLRIRNLQNNLVHTVHFKLENFIQNDSFKGTQNDSVEGIQIDSFEDIQNDSFKNIQNDSFKDIQNDSLKDIQIDSFKNIQIDSFKDTSVFFKDFVENKLDIMIKNTLF